MNTANAQSMPPGATLAAAIGHAQSGRIREAFAAFDAILAVDPRNVKALTTAGVLRCRQGDMANGIATLEKALGYAPDDKGVQNNLVQAYQHLYGTRAGSTDPQTVIAWLRRMLALGRDQELICLTNLEGALAGGNMPGQLSDYEPSMSPDELGRTILIACMPKSGSSWLVNVMSRLTGNLNVGLCHAYVENEQELYRPAVHFWAKHDKVVEQHCRASAPNLHLIQAYSMKPVILVRNLFDTLISMRDFWDSGAVRNSFFYGDWKSFDEDAKHEVLVRHVAPWYVQFYASWKLAESKGDVDMSWVCYEEMIPDKPGTLQRVSDFCGLSVCGQQIDTAIAAIDGERAKTRFNKGIAGRGDAAFTPAQKDLVYALTRAFPSIDFSPIGL